MNCDKFRRMLPLFLYDELSLEDEDVLQSHLEICEGCRDALSTDQSLHRSLHEFENSTPAGLLVQCRGDLRRRMQEERKPAPTGRWWRGLWDLPGRLSPAIWKPAGAVTLVAMGFFGARIVPVERSTDDFIRSFRSASAEPVAARVRYVNPDTSGGVQLVVDETRQRVLTGSMDDEHIRTLLLSAAKDPSNPGLRVETMDILKNSPDSSGVRGALLFALQNDSNAGVRLKAIEGLKQFSDDPDTRKALANVLLTDDNPGVRSQAIDLLIQQRRRENVGVLQELMRREDNSYIRQRCQRALRDMNASLETF